jgi:hypothetical protein
MNWRSSESASQPPRLCRSYGPDPRRTWRPSRRVHGARTTETARLFGGSERRRRGWHPHAGTPQAVTASATGYRSTATPGRSTRHRSAVPLQNGGIEPETRWDRPPAVSQGNGHHAYPLVTRSASRVAGERLAGQRRVTKQGHVAVTAISQTRAPESRGRP